MTEASIRERVESWAVAIGAKNIEGVMSIYAPNLVSFDLDPPLRYHGCDNKRRAWEEFFAAHSGDIRYEVHELDVTLELSTAFAHSLNHVQSVGPGGVVNELWLRWTACFRRIDGIWLITHDHASLPVEVKSGRAATSLAP